MGTKAQEQANGCWSKAMDDEPMFILLARDAGAPALVREWADERMEQINAGTRPKADLPQVQEAYQCAGRMEAWREANDGAWRLPPGPATGDLFTIQDATVATDYDRTGDPASNFANIDPTRRRGAEPEHTVRREGDEWACRCGTRWPVADGTVHP